MDTSARQEDYVITSEEEFDRLPQNVKMRQDLKDPERRIALQEEYKKELPRFYPDIREELHLTAEQEGRLFDLLTDFQLQHLDLFYTQELDRLAKHKRIQENEQRRDEALHSLLGTGTLQRYQHYQLDLWERQYVGRLVRWLNPANALSWMTMARFATGQTARTRSATKSHERSLLQFRAPRRRSRDRSNPARLRRHRLLLLDCLRRSIRLGTQGTKCFALDLRHQ
jgi:hypothetical protein